MNKFLFVWDMRGIESIILIDDYEDHDMDNTATVLKGGIASRNPLDSIVFGIMIRARANTHRYYEIYTVACEDWMDKEFWEKQWNEYPQMTADLVREKGHKVFGERMNQDIKIR